MRAWRGIRRAASSSSSSSSSSSFGGGRPRRRAWETSLSPLERLKRLLPPEEAAEAGRCAAADAVASPGQVNEAEEPRASPSPLGTAPSPLGAASASLGAAPAPVGAAGRRHGPFRAGELALAELRRKRNTTVKLLCRLADGAVVSGSAGRLHHRDIIGQLPGRLLRTSAGKRLLLRRPSLDEYVLLMPRGPTIAYPKDVSAILTMMDIHPGDTVLESGSGSGAMSLFLSRAVGPKGRVLSYEIRDDHHNLAKKNYRHWRAAWEIGHEEEWPDNVDFILKDITTAAADMKSLALDAIVLDMLNPQSALPVVQQGLKQGGVCAVYLANITQVIGLLDRIQTCRLPFLCEKVIEVTHRNWLVLPAKIKNCKSSQTLETQENIEEQHQKEYEEIHIQDQVAESEYNESLSDAEAFCSVPYVARPSFWQESHSAFLTKLRKFQPLHS